MKGNSTNIRFIRLAVITTLSLAAAFALAITAPEANAIADSKSAKGDEPRAGLTDSEPTTTQKILNTYLYTDSALNPAPLPGAKTVTKTGRADANLVKPALRELGTEQQLFISTLHALHTGKPLPISQSPLQSHEAQFQPAVYHEAPFEPSVFLSAGSASQYSKRHLLSIRPLNAINDKQIEIRRWLGNSKSNRTLGQFAHVGFPHIEQNGRLQQLQYKPYKTLIHSDSANPLAAIANVACMGLSPAAVEKRAARYAPRILELAISHNVSASLVKAVVAKESCFNPKALSPVGAMGLMQLMPETARWLNVSNAHDSNQNLAAGVRYLGQLRKRFGSDELALAAYNAGPGNVERYKGIPPFAETKQYVKDVMSFYRGYVAVSRFINQQAASMEWAYKPEPVSGTNQPRMQAVLTSAHL